MSIENYEEEELNTMTLREISQDRVSNNFLTHTINPIKILVMIISICQQVQKKF